MNLCDRLNYYSVFLPVRAVSSVSVSVVVGLRLGLSIGAGVGVPLAPGTPGAVGDVAGSGSVGVGGGSGCLLNF